MLLKHYRMLAIKSVKQNFQPSSKVLFLMTSSREMTNDCIRVGLRENASTLKRLSLLAYGELRRYEDVPSYLQALRNLESSWDIIC
jgi:putative transposase